MMLRILGTGFSKAQAFVKIQGMQDIWVWCLDHQEIIYFYQRKM